MGTSAATEKKTLRILSKNDMIIQMICVCVCIYCSDGGWWWTSFVDTAVLSKLFWLPARRIACVASLPQEMTSSSVRIVYYIQSFSADAIGRQDKEAKPLLMPTHSGEKDGRQGTSKIEDAHAKRQQDKDGKPLFRVPNSTVDFQNMRRCFDPNRLLRYKYFNGQGTRDTCGINWINTYLTPRHNLISLLDRRRRTLHVAMTMNSSIPSIFPSSLGDTIHYKAPLSVIQVSKRLKKTVMMSSSDEEEKKKKAQLVLPTPPRRTWSKLALQRRKILQEATSQAEKLQIAARRKKRLENISKSAKTVATKLNTKLNIGQWIDNLENSADQKQRNSRILYTSRNKRPQNRSYLSYSQYLVVNRVHKRAELGAKWVDFFISSCRPMEKTRSFCSKRTASLFFVPLMLRNKRIRVISKTTT